MSYRSIAWGLGIAAAAAVSLFISARLYFASSLSVSNQAIVDSIRVSFRLGSPKGGFIIISKIEAGNEADWLQIAITEHLPPGTYTNMVIPVPPDAEASGTALIGSTMIAYLFEDTNRNGILEASDKKLRQKIFQDTQLPGQDNL